MLVDGVITTQDQADALIMDELGMTSYADYLDTPEGVLVTRLVYRRERAAMQARMREAMTPRR